MKDEPTVDYGYSAPGYSTRRIEISARVTSVGSTFCNFEFNLWLIEALHRKTVSTIPSYFMLKLILKKLVPVKYSILGIRMR